MYNKQLDAFIVTAESGSFSKAAKQLYISPNAVMQQVSLLEQRLNLKLFERTHRGVALTPAGTSLVKDARSIINLANGAVRKAHIIQDFAHDSVRIATSLLFKCRYLPGLCAQMVEEHPGFQFEIRTKPASDEEISPTRMQGLGIDYDMYESVYLPASHDGRCQFIELCRTPLCASLRRGHPLAKRTEIGAEELRTHNLIALEQGVAKENDSLLSRINAANVTYYPRFSLDVFAMCQASNSVLLGPQIFQDIHPELVCIPIQEAPSVPYGVIYALNASEAVERFAEFIKKHG